jgi:hypothetical protein
MHGAAFALIVNTGLFAMSFGIIAFTNPTHRSCYAVGLSYAVGMLTPELMGWMPPPAGIGV